MMLRGGGGEFHVCFKHSAALTNKNVIGFRIMFLKKGIRETEKRVPCRISQIKIRESF